MTFSPILPSPTHPYKFIIRDCEQCSQALRDREGRKRKRGIWTETTSEVSANQGLKGSVEKTTEEQMRVVRVKKRTTKGRHFCFGCGGPLVSSNHSHDF